MTLLLSAVSAASAAEPPRVVVSLAPVHSLIAGVMEGVGEPALLVEGAASPHTYSLRPSDARALEEADIVFWVGEQMETFLVRPLRALADDGRVVALIQEADLKLLPTREGGIWENGEHAERRDVAEAEGHDHRSDDHTHGAVESHVWLDIDNAKAIVAEAVTVLSAADAGNSVIYRSNGEQLRVKLEQLDAELREALWPVRDRPFVVFHDAYHYFEARYHLSGIGTVTVSPEKRAGARRLQNIHEKVRDLGAVCVFAEPQFEPRLISTIIEGTSARKGVLDPYGADLPPGSDLYPKLMRRLAHSLVDCLSSLSRSR